MLKKLKMLKQAMLFIKDGAYKRFHGLNKPTTTLSINLHISNSAIIEPGANLFADSREINSSKIVIHDKVWIAKNAQLKAWKENKIIIKDYTTIQENCQIYGDVTIEKYCIFSLNCYLSSGTHYTNVKPQFLIREQDSLVLSSEQGQREHNKPIHIEEDCFIGYGVFIKQGIRIGRGAVIGAYSVITKDVEPYSVMAGQPAKKINERLIFSPPNELLATIDEHLPYFYRGFLHKKFELDEARKNNLIFAENEVYIVLQKNKNDKYFNLSGKILSQIDEALYMTIELADYKISVQKNLVQNFSIQINLEIENSKLKKPAYLNDFHLIKIVLHSNSKQKWGVSKATISQ